MNGQEVIEELFAFVVVDEDGTEGVPAVPGPGGMVMPLMGADTGRVESLRPIAQMVADQLDKDVTLYKFTGREELVTLTPEADNGSSSSQEEQTSGDSQGE